MKVSVVRGALLNAWELQSFLPLASRFDITIVGAGWQLQGLPFSTEGLTMKQAWAWGEWLGKFSKSLPGHYNRFLSWTTGRSYGLCGLEKIVRGSEILHATELYFTMTHQCLEIKKRHGGRVVVTAWENLPGQGERHPARARRKADAIRNVDGVIAVTETTRRLLVSEGYPADRIAVMPMGIDVKRFAPAPRNAALAAQLGISPDDLVVLFVGRLVEEKGVRELLSAAQEVLRSISGKKIRFLFVGRGPLADDIRRAQRETGGAVVLCPFMKYDDIPKIHGLADVFVLPSKPAPQWEEQFGYVLVESMASGKAVISTRSGSIPDVVGDAGVLVSPGNSDELARAILDLLSYPNKREALGQAALRRACSLYDCETVAARIGAFYEETVRRPAAGGKS